MSQSRDDPNGEVPDGFDDVPRSVTEESSLVIDEKRGNRKDGRKTLAAELEGNDIGGNMFN